MQLIPGDKLTGRPRKQISLDSYLGNAQPLMLLLFLSFKDSCEYNFDTQTNCPVLRKPVKHSAPHTLFCQFVHLCHFATIYRPFCLQYFLHSSGDGFPILPALKEVNLFYWLIQISPKQPFWEIEK